MGGHTAQTTVDLWLTNLRAPWRFNSDILTSNGITHCEAYSSLSKIQQLLKHYNLSIQLPKETKLVGKVVKAVKTASVFLLHEYVLVDTRHLQIMMV
jgi:hypothetical protein